MDTTRLVIKCFVIHVSSYFNGCNCCIMTIYVVSCFNCCSCTQLVSCTWLFHICACRLVGEVERNIYISQNIMNNFV
jgi:hypothetical protein